MRKPGVRHFGKGNFAYLQIKGRLPHRGWLISETMKAKHLGDEEAVTRVSRRRKAMGNGKAVKFHDRLGLVQGEITEALSPDICHAYARRGCCLLHLPAGIAEILLQPTNGGSHRCFPGWTVENALRCPRGAHRQALSPNIG